MSETIPRRSCPVHGLTWKSNDGYWCLLDHDPEEIGETRRVLIVDWDETPSEAALVCDCGHAADEHWQQMGPVQMIYPAACRECRCAAFTADGWERPYIVHGLWSDRPPFPLHQIKETE